MGVFNKTKKYRKTSQGIEEKLKLLEKEEKKNIQEIMTTDNMYSIVEPIPEVPPTPAVYTDVPDPNGVKDPAWNQPTTGGDENDSATWENGWSDTSWLYNSNEVFGETDRPVLVSTTNGQNTVGRFAPGSGLIRAYVGYGPSLGYIGAGNVYKGLTYASYWGNMYAAVEENFGGVWSQKPYTGYYEHEKALMIDAYAKMVDMDNRGVTTKAIKVWYPYSYFWYGLWENVGYVKRDHPTYGKQVLINASIYMEASKYESEPWKPHIPAWNKVIQQRALASGNDPENFPGSIEVGGKLFKKSKEAIQKMLEESGQDVALWGKGSTGGHYDKGWNPDHPDGTQQLNPFKPGSSLYNQFEKQRELQKLKDMGLVMNSEPWNDTKVAGLFDAIKSGGSGGKVPTTKNKAGVTDAKYVEAGMMTPQQFKDKWGMDPRDYENLPQASAGGNDNNIAQFPTQDLGGLGAKDGDLVAWGKPKGPPPTDAKLGRASDMNVVNWYNSGGDVGSKPEGWTMQDVRDYLNNRDKGFQSSNKKKQNVIATSYDPEGHVIYEAEWMFDKDPLVKKSDAFGNKQGQKTWFKVKDIKPEYPKKKVPKLKNLRHPKAYENQFSDRAKKIKVTSQDLIRNYKVSPQEIAQYHALVDIINKFIDDNPERSEMIAKRYPVHDPRLCELNFKLDRMKEASEKYVESKFPENKKVTSRIVKILKKNKEMTDPESFTMAPSPPTYSDYQKLKLRESATRHFKKPVQIKSWHKGHLTKP
tara:strand:- start:489 stop:2750 length:2262 start_codon:yes stop_codon:yes gene_type:complete